MSNPIAAIETVYDVLREVVQGLARVGGIGEEVRTAAHAVINEADPAYAEAQQRAAEAPLTPAEQEQLAALEKRQAAQPKAEAPPAQDKAEVPPDAAPPVAAPGAGFQQAPASGPAQPPAGF
jgi:hypothetical protein